MRGYIAGRQEGDIGDCRYQQLEDQTPLKVYKSADHGGPKRREAYYSRHGKESVI